MKYIKMEPRNKFNEKAWYVDFGMGFLFIILNVYVSLDYIDFMQESKMPSGKGGKLGLAVLKYIYIRGGIQYVQISLLILAALSFYWAYSKYKRK